MTKVDDVEEAPPRAAADAGAGDADREVRLAGPGAADEHEVALLQEEAAAGEVTHERLVDRRLCKGEVLDLLGERQLRHGDLVLDRARLLLGELGCEQVADDPLRLMLPLDRGRDDLIVGRPHAEQLEPAHGGQDLGSLHHPVALLRRSYRAQSAAGSCRSRMSTGTGSGPLVGFQ